MTVSDVARDLASRAPDNSEGDPWRPVAALLTEWQDATSAQRQAMLNDPPPPTGDRRWDAVVVALAEHLALHGELQLPGWVQDACIELVPAWFPVNTPEARLDALRYAPASFACRGVFLDRRALERA